MIRIIERGTRAVAIRGVDETLENNVNEFIKDKIMHDIKYQATAVNTKINNEGIPVTTSIEEEKRAMRND